LQETTPLPNQPWPVKIGVVLGAWPLLGSPCPPTPGPCMRLCRRPFGLCRPLLFDACIETHASVRGLCLPLLLDACAVLMHGHLAKCPLDPCCSHPDLHVQPQTKRLGEPRWCPRPVCLGPRPTLTCGRPGPLSLACVRARTISPWPTPVPVHACRRATCALLRRIPHARR
jgi:hypothetical protein